MPADIIGVSVFDRASEAFRFQAGPIFTQVLLADEINRATPKTQSALLEAMGEGRVTHDGESRELPDPFFVIATQNPNHQVGTFPLPESQLDRFTTRIALGYPEATAERELLRRGDQDRDARTQPFDRSSNLDTARAESVRLGSGSTPTLAQLQQFVSQVSLSDVLLDYVQALLKHSRDSGWYAVGLSPRAGISLVQMARAIAAMNERDFVVPEDVQQVLPGVVAHRLRLANQPSAHPGQPSRIEDIARPLLEQVPVD
jgi:MoxR-like ATPase